MGVELVEHELRDIHLGAHRYSVLGFLPRDTEVFQDSTPELVRFVADRLDARREIAGCLLYRPDRLLRILLFSCEQNGPEMRRMMDPTRLAEDVVLSDMTTQSEPEVILARLHERARMLLLSVRATLLEIDGRGDDAEENIAVISVFTAGLPPLVHIGPSGFSFPVRSGLPAGVLPEWFTMKQKMEWSPGEQVNCHTDLPGAITGETLRAFHDLLRTQAPMRELPDDMVVLRIRFED